MDGEGGGVCFLNLLNKSLESSWRSSLPPYTQGGNGSIVAENYLLSVEKLIQKSNIRTDSEKENLIVKNCTDGKCVDLFNISVSLTASVSGDIKTVAYKYLQNYLPNNDSERTINSLVVSTAANVTGEMSIVIDFQLQSPRPRDVELICVFWDSNTHAWSDEGCSWEGPFSEGRCVCTHLSSFAILMSKTPLRVPALSLLTTVGLSISIASLIIILAIEMTVWKQVVKTNTLYLRHTAQVNISVCLLVADICFLASSKPDGKESHGQTTVWCRIFAVMMHFCYLAMFFWMLALSTTLLHQAVFLFHKVSKKTYLRFSIFLGYICPLLIVFITFLANNAGAEGSYFSEDTCWLVYAGLLKGSIFTFILPVGIIVFFNIFSMLVVIMKLLEHHKNDDTQTDKEKAAAKTVIRSVVLLTPIFGVTWGFGLAMMILDLTSGPVAYAINYIFIILNAFQGFYILLTTCLLINKNVNKMTQRFDVISDSAVQRLLLVLL
uniref:Adhesion G protein-coupled receptor F3b n=1 Tax=Oryzias melastigma TaxID=30732 RepID=A0A3B3E1S0_ORYME